MTAHLIALAERAEATLAPHDRDTLALLVESFIATHNSTDDFTAREREHLKSLDTEPFEAAEPKDVADLFGRRA